MYDWLLSVVSAPMEGVISTPILIGSVVLVCMIVFLVLVTVISIFKTSLKW